MWNCFRKSALKSQVLLLVQKMDDLQDYVNHIRRTSITKDIEYVNQYWNEEMRKRLADKGYVYSHKYVNAEIWLRDPPTKQITPKKPKNKAKSGRKGR